MSAVDSPTRATSQKDDQEYSAESGDEVSHLTNDDGASEQGEPRRKSKRARKVTSKSTAPRKKYVKGKQGALQGMMKMPIEVFTEIAYHITPADLITLIRTNKFFRAMLLRRSSLLIWQHAQANVPELPPCPAGMSEPQYAALIFSKFCTLCGASTPAKPDPWLRVRLCASCRDTKLEDTNGEYDPAYNFVVTSCCIKQGKTLRRGNLPFYCLREEFEKIYQLRQEFQQKDDHKGLKEWERERYNTLRTQNVEAEQLLQYIDSVAESRANELGDLKAERREQVYERLKALGWDEKYFDFLGDKVRAWTSLVDVPKPLTERIWTNLLPKLTPLLEENKIRIDDNDKRRRRFDRLEKVQRLMCEFKRDTHPYQTIVDALGLTIPTFKASYDTKEVLDIPFPTIDTAVGWDFIKDIYEEENSLEQVEELFNQRWWQLDDKVLKWREEIENQLVKQYAADGNGAESMDLVDPFVLVQNSTEATEHLSPSARFLLRADTVFIRQSSLKHLPPEDQEYARGTCASHFPAMISTFRDCPGSYTYYPSNLTYLHEYVRHAGVEKIAKALLNDMGMPDVAHIELNSKGDAFACGRCYGIMPKTWEDLLDHYQYWLRQWVGGKYRSNNYSTRHPVTIRNVHDLMSKPDAKPLVHMVSDDERKANKNYSSIKEGRVWCLICSGVGWYEQSARDSLELMQEHLGEMHDVTAESVEGLHYTKDYSLIWKQPCRLPQWQRKWDAHYDAQQSGDTVESETQAGPSDVTETATEQI